MSKNVALLLFLYFIQGLPYGFQARFLPVFLRSQGVSLTSLGFFKLLLAPWLCKALWAPLVDKYATKRKWLLWSVFGLIVTCAFASVISPSNTTLLCLVLLSLNLCAATQDIVVDGIAVSILSSDELGPGNTAQVVGYKIGSIFGGGVLVWFVDIIGWTGLFIVLTLLYTEAWMFVYVSPKMRHFTNSYDEENASNNLNTGNASSNNLNTDNAKSDITCHEDVDNDGNIPGDDVCEKDEKESDSSCAVDDINKDNQILIENEDKTSDIEDETDIEDKDTKDIRNKEEDRDSQQGETLTEYLEKEDELQEDSEEEMSEFRRFISDVWTTPGTKWLLLFVLLYKLGEQGVTGMLPLYLVDKDVSTNDVTFWAGMLGQGLSIFGSLAGGWIISVYKLPVWLVMNQACLLRVMPMGILLQIIMLWDIQLLSAHILYCGAVLSYCVLMIFSGMITTATFTSMMQCSRLAPARIQATHYTVLATVEVLGKLTFASAAGYMVDVCGYMLMFLVFVILSVAVIPLFKYYPFDLRDDVFPVIEEYKGEEDEAGNGKEENKERKQSTEKVEKSTTIGAGVKQKIE